MRRNLKKPVALLTAALTAASLLAGCGGSSEEGTGADAGTQVNETDTAGAAAETPEDSAETVETAGAEAGTYPLAEGGTLTYWLQLNPNVSANFTNLGDTEKHGRNRPE